MAQVLTTTIDRYAYKGELGEERFCKVELYGDPDVLVLVVLTELAELSGTSMIDASAVIISQIVKEYGLPRYGCNFVEYTAPNKAAERYSIVTFAWTEDLIARGAERRTITPRGFLILKQEALRDHRYTVRKLPEPVLQLDLGSEQYDEAQWEMWDRIMEKRVGPLASPLFAKESTAQAFAEKWNFSAGPPVRCGSCGHVFTQGESTFGHAFYHILCYGCSASNED